MKLVLGTAQFAPGYGISNNFWEGPNLRTSIELVRAAEKLGCIAVDTAPIYGRAEQFLGATRTTLPIHTKIDPSLQTRESIEKSLDRLQRSSIDLVYFHRRLGKKEVALRGSEWEELLGEGLVGSFGASIYDLEELRALETVPVIRALQIPFNVVDRRFAGLQLQNFLDRGGEVFVRSVFLQGLLLASPDSIPERTSNLTPYLRDFWSICRDWGVPPIEAALNYVHRKLPYASIVVGARSATELEKIRGSSGGTYTDGVHHALEGMGVPSWRSVDPRKW